jgi:hypothetical protein
MGQATHAARILAELLPAEPAITHDALKDDAKRRLSLDGRSEERRYHRDGLIFETISWAAAQQATKGKALLRDPHLNSTTQGLDGLMLELDENGINRATIFEDKCSEHPRTKFRDEIMPAFKGHHENKRAADLIASAAALLKVSGLDGTKVTQAAARVLDLGCRVYRGSLAVTTADDSEKRRRALFKDYEELKGIGADQRIGAVLVTADDLRGWFDQLANRAIVYIDSLQPGDA